MPERRRRKRSFAAALIVSVLLPPGVASAQAGLSHAEDATLPPSGLLRIRTVGSWTRYDELFTDAGSRPLGAYLSSDSLGPRQVPALTGIQTLVADATAQPFSLTLGRSTLNATAREEIFPIGLEYGITRRIAVSFVTPIVRRRVAVVMQLDTAGVGANVGPNPQRTDIAASQANALVQTQFASAATQLQARLQSCNANPAGAGCAALLARQAEAQALIQSSQTFATTIASLYGSTATEGAAFVPIAQSAAQQAINARVATFNAQYQDLLGTTANVISASPRGAGGPAGIAEFRDYAVGELGADSLASQERLRIGDLEFGVKALLLDRPRTALRRNAMMLSIASSVRLPTGSRKRASQIVDLSSGSGSVIVDSRLLFDAHAARFGLFAAAAFAASVHDVDTSTVFPRPKQWTELQVAPRWYLSEPLSFFAAYSMRSTDAMGGDQLIGGGISYSTLAQYGPDSRSLPIEMRVTHLEAVAGDANRPKFFRDQIELRIYLRLLR
jgi:hypothetical protein